MKNISYILLFITLITHLHAALMVDDINNSIQEHVVITRGDIQILEASENIRFLSQQIVKGYFFLFDLPKKEELKNELNLRLIDLANNLNIIEKSTKDSDTQDILDFLAYSKDQISQMFSEDISHENAALLLDYSETLLEGADSIASTHMYHFTSEEKMLMMTKKMEYLLERMMKYYVALHIGFDNPTNKKQMHDAIIKFDANLQMIAKYTYPKRIDLLKKHLMKKWEVNKIFLKQSEKIFIPQLMDMSASNIEVLITQITLYHNQNQ